MGREVLSMAAVLGNVTLDHNAILDLEGARPPARHIRTLIAAHEAKRLLLRVAAVGGSECLPGRTIPSSFEEFEWKLASVGLSHVEVLKPIGRLDVTYWDCCVFADEAMIALEETIYATLFPGHSILGQPTSSDPVARANEVARARNRLCDASTLWCHIHYGGGIFVTSDRNFHKQTKRARLVELGAGAILTPEEAAAQLVDLSTGAARAVCTGDNLHGSSA